MIPYALPPAETKLSMRTLAGGYLAKQSPFADILCNYLGTGSCLLANSGKALLYLLFCHLRDMGGGKKTEVLIPGYTCYSVPAAAVKAGLKVALYDMDPKTLQPDMDDVSRNIGSKTLAVVGQHLLGVRSDIAALSKIAHANGICCIEDSAQRLDAFPKTARQKTIADFTVFSFGRGKPLPLGNGGALIASKPKELSVMFRSLERYHKKTGNFLLPVVVQIFSNPRLYWLLERLPLGLGRTVYDPAFDLSVMSSLYQRIGALGLGELEMLNEHRIAIGNIYQTCFNGNMNFRERGAAQAHVRYPLLMLQNGQVLEQLFKHGVRRLYPLALCDLPPLQDSLTDHNARTPGARQIAERLITLPTHMSVSESIAARIANEIQERFSYKTYSLVKAHNQSS